MDATPKTLEAAHQRMKARGRLKAARKLFEHRGWKVLPQGIRGQRILAWGAVMAWLAAETDQKREQSVRRWCRCWAPWLKDADLDQIVADTVGANKRWSNDECAIVLEIGVRDRPISLQFIGADDDHNYEIRHGLKQEKAAARARKYRAANGAKPRAEYEANSLSQTKPWEQQGFGCRRTWERWRKKAAAEAANVASASRDISLRTDSVTDLRHDHVEQAFDSRAPQAPRRAPEIVLEGEIILPGGVGLMPPPDKIEFHL